MNNASTSSHLLVLITVLVSTLAAGITKDELGTSTTTSTKGPSKPTATPVKPTTIDASSVQNKIVAPTPIKPNGNPPISVSAPIRTSGTATSKIPSRIPRSRTPIKPITPIPGIVETLQGKPISPVGQQKAMTRPARLQGQTISPVGQQNGMTRPATPTKQATTSREKTSIPATPEKSSTPATAEATPNTKTDCKTTTLRRPTISRQTTPLGQQNVMTRPSTPKQTSTTKLRETTLPTTSTEESIDNPMIQPKEIETTITATLNTRASSIPAKPEVEPNNTKKLRTDLPKLKTTAEPIRNPTSSITNSMSPTENVMSPTSALRSPINLNVKSRLAEPLLKRRPKIKIELATLKLQKITNWQCTQYIVVLRNPTCYTSCLKAICLWKNMAFWNFASGICNSDDICVCGFYHKEPLNENSVLRFSQLNNLWTFMRENTPRTATITPSDWRFSQSSRATIDETNEIDITPNNLPDETSQP